MLIFSVVHQSSPPSFCPEGRTNDLDAILDVIDKAEKYIHIAVMDYFPTTLYMNPMK
jgi:phospholipase D3/4